MAKTFANARVSPVVPRGRDRSRPPGKARVHPRVAAAALFLGAMFMASACGSDPAPHDPAHSLHPQSSPSQSGAVTSASPSASYLPTPEPELKVPERASGAVVTLTGTVERGEADGCRMLRLDGTTAYALVSTDAALKVGAEVTLEGRRTPGLATTCQHAVPFVVIRVVSVG